MAIGNRRQVDMLHGPILPRVLEFALPLMLSGFLQLLYNAADTAVVGRFVGPEALAAVGSVGPLNGLIINLFMGLSTGASVTIAHLYGGGRQEEVRQTVHTAITLAICSGLLVTVIGFNLAPQMLTLMDSPADVLPLSAKYLRIYFLGATANLVYNFGAGVLRAVGDTRRPLYILTISGLVNVVLNVILVVGFGLDVDGVAIATVASQVVSAAMVVWCLMGAEGCFRLDLRALGIHWDKVGPILRIGLPAGIQSILFSVSNVLIQSSVNSFGSTVVAGNAAAGNIEGFVYTGVSGFSQACMTFTSQNRGAGQFDRIDRVLLTCCGTMAATTLALGLGIWGFGESLLGIYTTEAAVVLKGMIRLAICCPPYFVFGLSDCLAGHLRGMGKSLPPTIISLCGICGFRVLWIYTVFAADPRLELLYISYPISWSLTALGHFTYSRVVRKQVRRENP